jgi:hypothetical protein
MARKEGLARGISKKQRLPIIRQHRLSQFEEAFDKYIRGEVPAEYVAERRKKLVAIRGKL